MYNYINRSKKKIIGKPKFQMETGNWKQESMKMVTREWKVDPQVKGKQLL